MIWPRPTVGCKTSSNEDFFLECKRDRGSGKKKEASFLALRR